MVMMLTSYLQSILWVHEEISSNVVKHNGVLPVVKFSVLPPYHTKGFHLEMCMPSNTLNQCYYNFTKQQTSCQNLCDETYTTFPVCLGLSQSNLSPLALHDRVSPHMQSHLQLWNALQNINKHVKCVSFFTLHWKQPLALTELHELLQGQGDISPFFLFYPQHTSYDSV